MRTEIIKNNGKVIAYVNLPCVCCRSSSNDKDELVAYLSREIEDSDNGYAGFNTKKKLNNYLKEAIFDNNDNNNSQYAFALDQAKIIKVVAGAIKKCSGSLSGGIVNVFVFQTFSQFVKDEMSGTTGHTPWQDTILVFINPVSENWEKALPETIGHEFNHAVFFRKKRCETLIDSLVFEGLAEHFREQVIGGEPAPWSKIFDQDQAKKIFTDLRSNNLLSSTDHNLRREIFFGGGKYARWTGYTIGYYLVKAFLAKNQGLEWLEIMNRKISEILEGSGF